MVLNIAVITAINLNFIHCYQQLKIKYKTNMEDITPKEKAKHLALKFTSSTDVIKPNIASIRMALLCVDELKKQALSFDYNLAVSLSKFYDEVKEEIQKL